MSSSDSHKICSVVEFVLNAVETQVNLSGNKKLSDEDLLNLHSAFGSVLQRALDILEKYPNFTAYTTSNKSRTLIEIQGENDRCYRIFPKINFCPCLAFKHQVIERQAQVCCKHVLAGRIAQILGRIVEHEVTSEQYLMLVKSMFAEDKDG
ncbi:hypothetical protein NE865_15085 [Phthorimaea operculella]|nr:hypothetical protein NE865_15085 [Phthorimaea operculella]